MKNGSKLNERFRSSESVERVRLDQRQNQFLFAEDSMLTFMDTESYEQTQLSAELIGEPAAFLQDGMLVTIESYENTPLRVELPESVVMEVLETEPTVRGQTAAASYKPAILQNGIRTMVPPFIDIGDRIIVNTADGSYSKRAEA